MSFCEADVDVCCNCNGVYLTGVGMSDSNMVSSCGGSPAEGKLLSNRLATRAEAQCVPTVNTSTSNDAVSN